VLCWVDFCRSVVLVFLATTSPLLVFLATTSLLFVFLAIASPLLVLLANFASPLEWLLNCSSHATPGPGVPLDEPNREAAMSERGAFVLSGCRGGDIGAPP
jgi:hypothetical protein